jgi:hypothetical protein
VPGDDRLDTVDFDEVDAGGDLHFNFGLLSTVSRLLKK